MWNFKKNFILAISLDVYFHIASASIILEVNNTLCEIFKRISF